LIRQHRSDPAAWRCRCLKAWKPHCGMPRLRPVWNIRWPIAVENRDFTDNSQLV
jgi:hypothetical protein